MGPTLVLDNGASSIKAGLVPSDETEPRYFLCLLRNARLSCCPTRIVFNAIVKPKGGSNAKLYIGHEIDNCRDVFGLYYRRPFEKVYRDLLI